uniref:15-oxoprostaglandin 13-reductase n=1 Tax=Arion vulgaris TaxID=1028688 RepID=A0A0B7BAV6_9EUPU
MALEGYFIIASSSVKKIPVEASNISPTVFLSTVGLTGLTAYFGITEDAHVTKGANQTVVVSGAAGATGSAAGQIAKLEGCGQVVGICGSDSKCACLTEELGFDSAINYKTEVVAEKLKELCPGGVDVYFDNVGGSISDDVIRLMNPDSYVVLCGQIAIYNKNLPYPPPVPDEISAILETKNITRKRFLVLTYQEKFESAFDKLLELHTTGKIKVKETIEMGLSNTGRAFVSMMKGGNLGKQLVKVTEE